MGVNRAIIYRHFTGKEELFALTQVDYLGDLERRLEAADDQDAVAGGRLRNRRPSGTRRSRREGQLQSA